MSPATNLCRSLVLVAALACPALGGRFFEHPDGMISGGARWDAAPRMHGANERSLDGGLRYSLQGGSFAAYRDLFQWAAVPTVPDFQQAVEQAFAAWLAPDPVTGLATDISFVLDLATPVVGSGVFDEGDPNGAEIDLLAVDIGMPFARGFAFADVTDSPVKLTSGTVNYAGSQAIIGTDITINTGAVYTLDVFRRLLTHEIGHTLGLGDVDLEQNAMKFLDDNFAGSTSAAALATLTNSWALLVNPLNPAVSPLAIYDVPDADPGFDTPGVDILMESAGLGVSPSNPFSELVPLRNDDFGMRQFLYPSLTSSFPPGDFDRSGTVDAADYVVWRNQLGTTFVATDYQVWSAHFQKGGAVDAIIVVPEPLSHLLFALALLGFITNRWPRARAVPPMACSKPVTGRRPDKRVGALLVANGRLRAVT